MTFKKKKEIPGKFTKAQRHNAALKFQYFIGCQVIKNEKYILKP